MIAEILSSHPMFAGLTASEIYSLVEILHERSYPSGEIIFQESASSELFIIVIAGEVEIIKSLGTSDERCIAVRGPGTLLGEMSIFSDTHTHTASVRTRTPLQVLEMARTQFGELIHSHPDQTYHLLGILSRRLEESENATILDLREKNRQLTQAYQDLKAAQARLIEEEKLERELEIASKLQLSILPQRVPQVVGFDFGALMVPASSVGGDFYDFIQLGPDRLGIVVGDVCSKGIPAALFMTLTYTAMRSEALRHRNPGDALKAVNRRLMELNDTGMFVTILYGILDTTSRQFTFARAGHPRPLILDAQFAPLDLPSNTGQPVGLFEDFLLDEQSVQLPRGSSMLIYSDGLSETLENSGVTHDLVGLCKTLLAGHAMTAQELCAGLWKTVESSVDNSLEQDDFTVLALRIT